MPTRTCAAVLTNRGPLTATSTCSRSASPRRVARTSASGCTLSGQVLLFYVLSRNGVRRVPGVDSMVVCWSRSASPGLTSTAEFAATIAVDTARLQQLLRFARDIFPERPTGIAARRPASPLNPTAPDLGYGRHRATSVQCRHGHCADMASAPALVADLRGAAPDWFGASVRGASRRLVLCRRRAVEATLLVAASPCALSGRHVPDRDFNDEATDLPPAPTFNRPGSRALLCSPNRCVPQRTHP